MLMTMGDDRAVAETYVAGRAGEGGMRGGGRACTRGDKSSRRGAGSRGWTQFPGNLPTPVPKPIAARSPSTWRGVSNAATRG